MPTSRIVALAVIASALAASVPTAALAASAPGRVSYPVPGPATRDGVDPFAVSSAMGLPDGGVLTAGMDGRWHLVLARLRPDGSLDPGFGKAGIAVLSVSDDPARWRPYPERMLRTEDGGFIVLSTGPSPSRYELERTVVTRVLPDGRLDPTFGTGGVVISDVSAGEGALQPDGSVVLAGATGGFTYDPKTRRTTDTRRWVVERLTPNGSRDAGFGENGIVTIPGRRAGVGIAVLPRGALAVAGMSDHARARLVVLRPDGGIDPSFNDGRPVDLAGLAVRGVVARADGAVDVLSWDFTTPDRPQVQRITRDGSFDPGFGSGGALTVPGGVAGAVLIAAPEGSEITLSQPGYEPPLGKPFTLHVARLRADGSFDPAWGGDAGRLLPMPFGGGLGTVAAIHRLPVVGPLRQTGVRGGVAVPRPDGGLVIAGPVGVIQYTGEGEGYLHEEIAAAAFRPDLTTDTLFGGPAARPTLGLRLPPQRARTAAGLRRRYVSVLATASGAGLCRVEVRAGRHVLARTLAPVFGPRHQRLRVFLTSYGRTYLTHARNVRVSVTARFRDLLTGEAYASTRGVLR